MVACEHLLVARSLNATASGSLDFAEARTLDCLRARFDEMWRRPDKPNGTRTMAARIAHDRPVIGRGRAAARTTRTVDKLEHEGIDPQDRTRDLRVHRAAPGRYVRELTGQVR
jgi:hypothetical protein